MLCFIHNRVQKRGWLTCKIFTKPRKMKNNGRQTSTLPWGFFADDKPHPPFSQKWEFITLATSGDLNGME